VYQALGVGGGGGGPGSGGGGPQVFTLGVDVSHSGEATYLYRRFAQKTAAAAAASAAGGSGIGANAEGGAGAAAGGRVGDGGGVGGGAKGFSTLIVDIGANDGFLSSNSYNLAEWGWSTVLVVGPCGYYSLRHPPHSVPVLATTSTTQCTGAHHVSHLIVYRCSPRHPPHSILVYWCTGVPVYLCTLAASWRGERQYSSWWMTRRAVIT